MLYHLTPVRMAVTKSLQRINAGEDVENVTIGMWIGAATMENSMEFP